MPDHDQPTHVIDAAVQAYEHGYVPIPLRARSKAPGATAWTQITYDSAQQVRARFTDWTTQGLTNLGLALGEPSSGLIDVDLDHPATTALKRHFLPPTAMRSGRASRPLSHYWYRVSPSSVMQPGTRRYKMPDGAVSVELRSTRGQTAVPPSVHPKGEDYAWTGPAWGGPQGPAEVDGQKLAVQVALLALGCILIENWPRQGSRHEAYLALAGGLLRLGRDGVHPWWEKNLPVLITALADCTHDEDGATTRVAEVMDTTLGRLRSREGHVSGWPTLAGVLGEEHVAAARSMAREVESLAGFERDAPTEPSEAVDGDLRAAQDGPAPEGPDGSNGQENDEEPPQDGDEGGTPRSSWEPVDLEPILAGEVEPPTATVFRRDDGACLMYAGRVNMLYGSSESAKSWLALVICLQQMARGERVMYLDFEDEAVNTMSRLQALGAGEDDVRLQFTYVNPEEPLSEMQRTRYGEHRPTPAGRRGSRALADALATVDPTLIIVDGMTVLYGLHGLDTDKATDTDIITGWLKRLTRSGRSTVVVIDHTGKTSERGSLPIGSQHKKSMVQGTMLQVWVVDQPMPGAVGLMDLMVLKDRPGAVRAISEKPNTKTKAQTAARVQMDSRTEGVTRMTFQSLAVASPPTKQTVADYRDSPAAARAMKYAEQRDVIVAAFDGMGDDHALSGPDIRLRTSLSQNTARARLQELVDEGVLVPTGTTRDRRYILVVQADD